MTNIKQNVDSVLCLLRQTYIGSYAIAAYGNIETDDKVLLKFGEKTLVEDVVFSYTEQMFYITVKLEGEPTLLPLQAIKLSTPIPIFKIWGKGQENKIGKPLCFYYGKNKRKLKIANILQDGKKQLYRFSIYLLDDWYYFSVRDLPFFYPNYESDGENVNPPPPTLEQVRDYFLTQSDAFLNDFPFSQNFTNTFTTRY